MGAPGPHDECAVWRSFEHLTAYSRNRDQTHYPYWVKFNKEIGSNGDIGIWHETFLVRAGEYECIYNNMPLRGLAKAARHVDARDRAQAPGAGTHGWPRCSDRARWNRTAGGSAPEILYRIVKSSMMTTSTSTGVPASRPGSKRHCATALTARSSSPGLRERTTRICEVHPSRVTTASSTTVP